jgi:hypothetical protein
MFIKLKSGGSVLCIRADSIYAVRTYGTTLEVYYGFKETVTLPFKGNETTVRELFNLFEMSDSTDL